MISVIIPCYNAEKTIMACLEPLLAGSFGDFEIIIADDGSTDNTLPLCRQIADSRIRILAAEKNEGVSRARNRGLDQAKGDYVASMDADDTVVPDYLAQLSQAAYAGDCDWVASAFSFVDETNPAREVLSLAPAFPQNTFLKAPFPADTLPGRILDNQDNSTLASVCGCLYRRSLLEEYHIRFREGLRYGEDTLFNLNVAAHCHTMAYLARKLYRYHQHEGEATDVMFRRYRIQDFSALLKEIEQLRAENAWPLSRAESRYVLSQTFAFINHNALLKTKEEARAFYGEMDRCYWDEPAIQKLWDAMDKKDIHGKFGQIRFQLIKGKHWKGLAALQGCIRGGKKLKNSLKKA